MIRMPTFFISHGAGPCFFMDWNPAHEWHALASYLRQLPQSLPAPPNALFIISAHWEATIPTVTSKAKPHLIYDYSGFPQHTYDLQWPVDGAPNLAKRTKDLLNSANLPCASNADRGLDHGTFVPMLLSFPNADIPTIQLSLCDDLDAHHHLAIGKAIAPLRDEGVLIIGSGFSYHNMRGYNTAPAIEKSANFDQWLTQTVETQDVSSRAQLLAQWQTAPDATQCHPRSEHLAPLFVSAGAAYDTRGKCDFKGQVMGVTTSCFRFD